jgi:hypothetical protein
MERQRNDVSPCHRLLFLQKSEISIRRRTTRTAFGCEELDEYRLAVPGRWFERRFRFEVNAGVIRLHRAGGRERY